MNKKTLGFIVITVGVVAAAWYITGIRAPQTEVGTPPLFPELSARLNEVTRVEIRSRAGEVVLARESDAWVIDNRDRYPAPFEKVKRTVLDVADLKVVEPKTSRTEMYSRLGVEDVEAGGSASTLVTLKDGGGRTLAALLVGKAREGGPGGVLKHARYVRRSGEPQAFLVEGELEVPADPMAWTDRELMDIASTRIREIGIEHPATPAVVIRRDRPEDVDLKLHYIPAGFKPKSTAGVTSLATALQELRFDDVRARAAIAWPAAATVTTLRGFDGLVAKVSSAEIDGRRYAAFEFDFDPTGVTAAATDPAPAADEPPVAPVPPQGDRPQGATATKTSVAEEVKALNARLGQWVYVLPDYKQGMLTRTMDDLIAKIEEQKAPPATPPDPLKVERFDEQGNPIQ